MLVLSRNKEANRLFKTMLERQSQEQEQEPQEEEEEAPKDVIGRLRDFEKVYVALTSGPVPLGHHKHYM